jgi:hypothetical protein
MRDRVLPWRSDAVGKQWSTEADWKRDRATADLLAEWLDSKFEIPGTGIRFGIDAILGLLPGVGDAITSLFSLYILTIASRYNLPRVTQARMAVNIAIDWLMGSIPIVGDLFDVAWKSNLKNAALLNRHFKAHPAERTRHRRSDSLFLAMLIGVLLVVLAVAMTAAYFMVWGLYHLLTT